MTRDRDASLPRDFPLEQLLTNSSVSMTITNPRLADNPIVFVNSAFEQMTGYARAVVLGHNCRFLQGDDTDQDLLARLSDAITDAREISVTLKNYRANGSAFWNELRVSPIFDEDGTLAYFLGVQRMVASPNAEADELAAQGVMLQEIQHRVKNHLAMIVGLIRSQANQPEGAGGDGFLNLARRVEALQLLYEQFDMETAQHEMLDIGVYVGQVVARIMQMKPTRKIRVNIQADSADVPVDLAVHIGLILSELLTNALQHGFDGRAKGLVSISATQEDGAAGPQLRLIVTDDGTGFDKPDDWPASGGSGSRIINGLAQFSNASINAASSSDGTRIEIGFPLS